MDKGRVGEDTGSKEMDGCPLTAGVVAVGMCVQRNEDGALIRHRHHIHA
jgi:hypothetical protein